MTYSKKTMQPVIDKYGINTETNKLFVSICEMFDNKPNYQVWAVKMVFSMALSFEELKRIHDWISSNSALISKLSKKNIVSYSSKASIRTLFEEMESVEHVSFIKNSISSFNTSQRKMLTELIFNGKDLTPIEAYRDKTINKWYDIFKAFNKKPMDVRNKIYGTCSAIKDTAILEQVIIGALSQSYIWKEGKEDLLAFVEYNASDCDIVFNEGPCVILRVPSFESSNKLCFGRTSWCIAREEDYFNTYVTSHSERSQYFLFDFSRKESDAFAHIGFTTSIDKGIVVAQTCNNEDMLSEKYAQGDEELDIYDVFNKFNIQMSLFNKLPKDIGFPWDKEYFLNLAKKNKVGLKIIYDGNNRIVIKVKYFDLLSDILEKTFIDCSTFKFNADYTNFLLLDFNLSPQDDNAIIAASVTKDTYGLYDFYTIKNAYSKSVNKSYLSDIGISENVFFNQNSINPSVMLHKLINEGKEEEAIKLIEKEQGKIDVNYEWELNAPVYSAIYHKMPKLLDAIINTDGFSCQTENLFGRTIIQELIYLLGCDEVSSCKEDEKLLSSILNSIISSGKFDCNVKNINSETAISSACCFPKLDWVVELLASNPQVDVNVVDDFGFTPLKNCIVNRNFKALTIIANRPDLIVRESDYKFALENGFALDDFISKDKLLPVAANQKKSAKSSSNV